MKPSPKAQHGKLNMPYSTFKNRGSGFKRKLYTRIENSPPQETVEGMLLKPSALPRQEPVERVKAPKTRKGLRATGKRGEKWIFCSLVYPRIFELLGLSECEYHGHHCRNFALTPAHSLRRPDISMDDWANALRVALICETDHLEIDRLGRRRAEPIINFIIWRRLRRLGITEEQLTEILKRAVADVLAEDAQKAKPRFQHFEVNL